MKLIKPSVKHIIFDDNIQQIGYAASICYNSDKKGTVEWLDQLWKAGHRSPFRHAANYYIIPKYTVGEELLRSFKYSPYVGYYDDYRNGVVFVSFNEQYRRENTYLNFLSIYKVSELNFIAEANKNDCIGEVLNLLYHTFEIVTQISTSRELNRMSPNSICEQSTRYCNFTKEKYENHIKFCEPHWLDATTYYDKDKEYPSNERIFYRGYCGNEKTTFVRVGSADLELNEIYPLATKGISQKDYSALCYSSQIANDWIENCLDAEERYFSSIKYGMKPQDARGLLPLDVATKCIYTYRLEEWNHFLDLRLFGKTGDPHPNAKVVANMIFNILYPNAKAD